MFRAAGGAGGGGGGGAVPLTGFVPFKSVGGGEVPLIVSVPFKSAAGGVIEAAEGSGGGRGVPLPRGAAGGAASA